MKLTEFEETGQARWDELSALVARAGGRPERLTGEEILRLGTLYREATADLALARRRFPADPLTERLERLVTRAAALVYERPRDRRGVVAFLADDYWRLVAARRWELLWAAALLLVPAALGAAWALARPEAASAFLPPEFQWVASAETTAQGLGTVGLAGFSAFVFTNNIRVALLSFALGVTFGVGTAWVVLQNGFVIGSVVGLGVAAGNGGLVAAATVAHGLLELTCLVVAAAAGLAVGRAMLRPGTRTRRAAMAAEARDAFLIAAGTAPWLVLAAFVEAYVSRTGLEWPATVAVGVPLAGVYWAALATLGFGHQRRARRLARR